MVGDDQKTPRRLLHDLFAEKRAAPTFDQPQPGVDLICPVDGQIERLHVCQGHDFNASFAGLLFRLRGCTDSLHVTDRTVTQGFAEKPHQLYGGRSGAETDAHSALDLRECGPRGGDLQRLRVVHGRLDFRRLRFRS